LFNKQSIHDSILLSEAAIRALHRVFKSETIMNKLLLKQWKIWWEKRGTFDSKHRWVIIRSVNIANLETTSL